MSDEMTPEQVLEEQKKNCVFCKIVNGQAETKKVYEDDDFLAVLDIRPAAEGHLLLLPKEHVPILPVLPADMQRELFRLATRLVGVLREVRAAEKVTVFTASGAVAGQQAPHLIVHLIPRQPGDGLDMLDLSQRTVHQADTLAMADVFTQTTEQVVTQLGRADILGKAPKKAAGKGPVSPVPASFEEVTEPDMPARPQAPPSETGSPPQGSSVPPDGDVAEFDTPNEALQALLSQNPDLRQMIISEPALVEDYISRSENLKKLFSGVNIKALSLALRKQEQQAEKPARQMTDAELFAFIDGNEGLRTWLLEHPAELAEHIGQNPKLEAFLSGVDIMELARKYQRYRGVS